MLTAMNVEESYGSDVGMFYSEDVNQTIAANLLLAYEFLRNSENHISDMPQILDGNGVNVNYETASFINRDEAFVSIANQMIPDALDSLPPDQNLPVINIFEDKSASLELSQFQSVGGSQNSFVIDLTNEPVMTSKTLKTDWFNTSSYDVLSTKDIMASIHGFSLEGEAAYTLMTLMLYWNSGEQTLNGPGIPPMTPPKDFDVPEVVEDIVGSGLSGLTALYRTGVGLKGLKAYRSINFLQSKGWTLSIGSKSLPDLAKMGNFKKFKTWVKMSDRIQKKPGFFKKMNKVLEGLDTIALFADAGVAVYSIIAISQSSGISGLALNNALMKTTMEYYYTLMLFLIGSIPYVGWLVALAIEMSDVFGDWSSDLINFFIDATSGIDYTVTPDVSIVGESSITIDDKDENGLDVGDRIKYKSRLKGMTSGLWRLVYKSKIYPYYLISAPSGSSSTTGYLYSTVFVTHLGNIILHIPPRSQWTKTQYVENNWGWKANEYEAGAWIEPGMAMANFPVNLRVEAIYEMSYQWSHWVFAPFIKVGWCYHDSSQKGLTDAGSFALYFDVLPANIDDFANWRGITPLDHDRDGLNDANETNGSDVWRYDTDGDGLNDKYEVENGTNPARYDTDGDGLIDWYEIQYGTDVNNPDTDNDGIVDYLEVAGWLIEFEYQGQIFTTRVYSDPQIPDTDSDGVEDSDEYWSGLNPRSSDSNGDGIKDVSNPRTRETNVEFVKKIDIHDVRVEDIAVDANGIIYTLERILGYPGSQVDIVKRDSNFDYISTWSYDQPSQLYGLTQDILIDNQNRLLHVTHNYDHPTPQWGTQSNIKTFSLVDGNEVQQWATRPETEGPWNLALEIYPNGNIFVGRSGNWIHWDFVEPWWGIVSFIDIYDANRNLIDTWGDYAWNQEIDKFAYIADIAYNPVNGYLYITDIGYDMKKVFIGPRFRDDRIAVYTTDGEYLFELAGYHKDDLSFNFEYLSGADIDDQGNVYIADTKNYRIHKVDPLGVPIVSWGGYGDANGLFEQGITQILVDHNNIYALEPPYAEGDSTFHLHKFNQSIGDKLPVEDDVNDRDGDGLQNNFEETGWDITYTAANSNYMTYVTNRQLTYAATAVTTTNTIHVTSDPLLKDTDFDGLTDLEEYQKGTDPRNPDTDDDGVGDYDDINPLHFDTDGDGLPDAVENAYGSDPNSTDTDGDGLDDTEEFNLASDPNNPDTDRDGLTDSQEKDFNSNLLSPDTDGDFMFDGQEFESGTNPNNSDTDNDGLEDGIEGIYGTDPLNGDTDGDNVSDGDEIDMRLDPLSPDSDGDGIPDGEELDQGTNPLDKDSDHDGIPDGRDDDSITPHVDDLVLAYDPQVGVPEFIENLGQHTSVQVVSATDLLSQYADAPRIVLVGRPDSGDPVGTIIHSLLADTGEVLTNMIDSDENRLAVRYGRWTNPQTVVMLSTPYSSDYISVLDTLRKKTISLQPNSVSIQYNVGTTVEYPAGGSLDHGDLTYNFLQTDEIDTVKNTDAMVFAVLDQPVYPAIHLTRYDNITTPMPLNASSGLAPHEISLGRFIDVTATQASAIANDFIDTASVRMFYSKDDLDMTGDGDVNDPQDIDETSLTIYSFDQNSGQWIKLDPNMDWVREIDVNTVDVNLYGNSYAGSATATVYHLSFYALAGRPFNSPPDVSNAHANPDLLWPPNHKFVGIAIEGITDPDGDSVIITITKITSNQPSSLPNGKKHTPDALGVGTSSASLRAERLGSGDCRIYEINFVANDGKGGETVGSVKVYVPHSKKGIDNCIDDGQRYDIIGN